MLVPADEITRSLGGAWGLLQRDATGLRLFNSSAHGLRRSFSAVLLAAPVFVVALAAERAHLGVLTPGSGLFDDPGLVARMALVFVAGWAVPPLVAAFWLWGQGTARRLVTFTIACNWSGVLAALFFAMPAFMLARGLATPSLTAVYLVAFAIIVAHMRWFIARTALSVSGSLAAGLVAADMGLEYCVGHLLALA